MGTERNNAKEALEEYFTKKPIYTLQGFIKFRKEQLSRGTGLYIIEVDVERLRNIIIAHHDVVG